MKHLLIAFLSLITSCSLGQVFEPGGFDKAYLEHIVKIRIDAVRAKNGCKALVNDSILFVASNHHVQYMQQRGGITHYEAEKGKEQFKTPQLRAEFYGAKNYGVGENVLFTIYQTTITGKKGEKFDTHSYEGIADAMVNAWVNSPGHFKNIITPGYQVTGLSVAIDPEKKRLYACQKFAEVYYRYDFTESPTLFPHSAYVPPAPVTSFAGIADTLIPFTYDFKLRHDEPETCEQCRIALAQKPLMTLRVEGSSFVLKVENSAFVQQLIRDRRDGFAVEIVQLDDYLCGNPAYYTRPTRRNGQLRLNGKTLEPLYRKDLFRGYRKRKVNKDVRFIPYIFRKDSVAFFRRFGQYKIDRYSSEYFEIRLGRVPKTGYWNHNLVYIQDRQICHIDFFTSYCGALHQAYEEAAFIQPSANGAYPLQPEKKQLPFTIPFERGKSVFDAADIAPFTASLADLSYSIDSIAIHAYSSVEGDSLTNSLLQQKRAESIASVIRKSQQGYVPVHIRTSTDWDHFFKAVRRDPAWAYLSGMSREAVVKELQLKGATRLEAILQPERRGEIELFCTIPVTDKNLRYLIGKEHRRIVTGLEEALVGDPLAGELLQRFNRLYGYVHALVLQGKLPVAYLAQLTVPTKHPFPPQLLEKMVFYSYEFPAEFDKGNPQIAGRRKEYVYSLAREPQYLSAQFRYHFVRLRTQDLEQARTVKPEEVQDLLNMLESIRDFYDSDSLARPEIDRLNANLNMLLLNKFFPTDKFQHANEALGSIAQLTEFYTHYDRMDAALALKLARVAVEYNQPYYGAQLLLPYVDSDSAMAYLMTLSFQHPSFLSNAEEIASADGYYTKLVELSATMDSGIWCNLFFGECHIPFQVFDSEAVRNAFCATCAGKNEELKKLGVEWE